MYSVLFFCTFEKKWQPWHTQCNACNDRLNLMSNNFTAEMGCALVSIYAWLCVRQCCRICYFWKYIFLQVQTKIFKKNTSITLLFLHTVYWPLMYLASVHMSIEQHTFGSVKVLSCFLIYLFYFRLVYINIFTAWPHSKK